MTKNNNYMKLRNKFLEYFNNKNHKMIKPSSLVSKNDPSIFFTNAGMNQFKSYFTIESIAPYSRAVTIQPCIRAGGKHNDLDNVGFTARHHTFFEMMGNFSFYDYFKEEAISYALEFLIKELNIDENKLYFTVHQKDENSYDFFKKYTNQPVVKIDMDDNFWSMGEIGPCGYCGEIYYYIGNEKGNEEDFKNSFQEQNSLYLEIWNIVFMEFNRKSDGTLEHLEKKSIDTGMGLERILSIIEGTYHNYKTSIMAPLVETVKETFNVNDNAAYIGADHSKTTLFLLNEGVKIGSEGPSYVLRRIIRRALTYLKKPGFYNILPEVAKLYEGVYEFPNLQQAIESVKQEESLFFKTIENGYSRLEENINNINEATVFKLYETYGLPLEFSTSVLEEKGIKLDNNKIQSFIDSHKKISGQMLNLDFNYVKTVSTCYEKTEDEGIVQLLIDKNQQVVNEIQENQEFILITNTSPFYPRGGGQEGDRGQMYNDNFEGKVLNTTKKGKTVLHHCELIKGSIKVNDKITMAVDKEWRHGTTIHHSATHILHAILQKMFGKHIEQKGSFIGNDKMSFDCNLDRKLTPEEVQYIEQTMQNVIDSAYNVAISFMPFVQAKEKGAEYLSCMDYEEEVRVVDIKPISFVLCGGIHVKNTKEIGKFKIISDTGYGRGIRRLRTSCI